MILKATLTVPVSNNDDIEPNPNIIASKNKHGEM